MMTNEYAVLSPIKVVGDEIPKDQRPAALKGQPQRTHESRVVDSGTVMLSDAEAAPLLEAGAIRLASAAVGVAHDPEAVGFEGQAAREAAQQQAPAAEPSAPADGSPALTSPEDAGRASLLANGYDTDAKARAADDATLLSINGVGQATLEKIRQHLAV